MTEVAQVAEAMLPGQSPAFYYQHVHPLLVMPICITLHVLPSHCDCNYLCIKLLAHGQGMKLY